MACGSKFDSGNCVADILREIADAQTDLVSDCTTSCEQSISDLLGDTSPSANNLDTVPVILYCKGDCKPFKGYGVPVEDLGDAFGSFYFRVKSVDEDNCAVLELLREDDDHEDDPCSPAKQDTSHLEVTGVCITVDLDCFCHITCLPAINALD
ncbi:CotY/CotZ family spore coat protein [Aquibacillus rhizosphaerae]|uniref:CotY/CotZ family spore coat protein n=1 Tax=Aquibacillus rhizosphaerae TaxID=3051431 RepID=A0ABT7LCP7_9BACI|nr:CotY/CotZ family spore coat protein [Aquibacillus sp. LR5S19]MDL4842945.1 CotY/CotZ family spore coat protein [Aquibacillus sp. LR5S19]